MKIGLKLWSLNTQFYLQEAKRLFDNGFCDYIELYVVPDSLDLLAKWKELKDIPFIIHNSHFAHGFNLAKKEAFERNLNIFSQTKQYADSLNAKYIIMHGGMDGDIKETVRQLKALKDDRIIIENKPYIPLNNNANLKFCRGATLAEIKEILDNVGCSLCLDIGHAVCAANYQKIAPYEYVQNLNDFNPAMYHLSDVLDMTTVYDAHPHLGTGNLDFKFLKEKIFKKDSLISVETVKDSKENLSDFEKDSIFLKNA